MTVPHDTTHTRRPCPNCPSLLEVIDDVLGQIQTQSETPMSIADVDAENRQFLAALGQQLQHARTLAKSAA